MVEGSPELLLMAGTPFNLSCVTRGAKPAAHIQWTKDGAVVEGAYQTTVTRTLKMRSAFTVSSPLNQPVCLQAYSQQPCSPTLGNYSLHVVQ